MRRPQFTPEGRQQAADKLDQDEVRELLRESEETVRRLLEQRDGQRDTRPTPRRLPRPITRSKRAAQADG